MNRQPKKLINDYLGGFGLATLDDPRGMVQQLGFLIRDDDHFRQLLLKCIPEERHNMYESLRPYLRFPARPLEDYIIEGKQDAEARQLPTVDAEGNFHPYSVPETQTPAPVAEDDAGAQAAVNEAFAKQRLWLVCSRCTAEAVFTGDTRTDAFCNARLAGWKYQNVTGTGYETCPGCK
jgi:hypothetical protein